MTDYSSKREATPKAELVQSMRWGRDNEGRVAVELNGHVYTFTRLDVAVAFRNGLTRMIEG